MLRGILDNSCLHSNHRLRLAQYRAFEFRRIELARHFVRAKLESIEVAVDYPHALFLDRLAHAQTLEEILGVEGSASVYLFDAVREDLNTAGIPFERRSYRPPEDPPNGLLSLIYTLHYGWFHSLLLAEGYDPYIGYLGYLHHKQGRHAPLASDMMETMRVPLTLFVVECFLEGRVSPEDFDERHRLKPEKLRPVLSEYAQRFIHSEGARKQHRKTLESFRETLLCP